MKRFFLLLFLFMPFLMKAQFLPDNTFGKQTVRGVFTSALGIPDDTLQIPNITLPNGKLLRSYAFLASKGDTIYRWSPTQGKYVFFSAGAGSGGNVDSAKFVNNVLTIFRHGLSDIEAAWDSSIYHSSQYYDSKYARLFSPTDPITYSSNVIGLRQSLLDSMRHSVYSVGISGSNGKGTITVNKWDASSSAGSFLTGGWVGTPTAGQILTYDGTLHDWVNTTPSYDTSNISNFSAKVRSLFSGTYPLSHNNGVFNLDTSLGKWRSENYYKTVFQPIGNYWKNIPRRGLNDDPIPTFDGDAYYDTIAHSLRINFNGLFGALESILNRDTDTSMSSNSNSKYASQRAVVSYINNHLANALFVGDTTLKIDINTPIYFDSTGGAYTLYMDSAQHDYDGYLTKYDWKRFDSAYQVIKSGIATGIADGNYGDISVSSGVWEINNAVVTNSNLVGFIDAAKINTGVVSNAEFNYLDGVTSAIQTQIDSKQASLISGINLKTINGNSLLGSGDITVSGGFTLSGRATSLSNKAVILYDTVATTYTYADILLAKLTNPQNNDLVIDSSGYWVNRNASQIKTILSLSNVENIAISTWVGSTNITTLGTISSGTWQGSVINSTYLPSTIVYNTGSYSNPSWITSLSGTKVLPSYTGNDGKVLGLVSGSLAWVANGSGGGGTTTNALSIAAELHSGGSTTFDGSSAVSIAIQSGSVTNTMLAGSIDATKLVDGSVSNTELQYINSLTSNAQTQIDAKQASLVSGTNIKTINGNSILGSGNLSISATFTDNGYSSDLLKTKLAIIDTTTGLVYHTDYAKMKLTNRADNDMYIDSSGYTVNRTASQIRTLLGLVIGTNVQAYDADLTIYAGITPSANVQTLLGASNYAAFKTSLSINNVENTALSSWAGTSNITTLGTIATGIWHGTAIADSYISSAGTWNAKQDGDGDLTAIAALSGTSGYLKKTGTNTWTLDNSTFVTGASGSNTQIQYNNSGAFGASSDFTFNNSTKVLYANALTRLKERELDEVSTTTSANTATTVQSVPISDSYASGFIEFIATGYDATSNDASYLKVKCTYKVVAGTITITGNGTTDYYLGGTMAGATTNVTTSGSNIILQITPGTAHTVYWKSSYQLIKIIAPL